MFPFKKVLKSGKFTYYIRYRNKEGKLKYLPKDDYPRFSSKAACRSYISEYRGKFKDARKHAEIIRLIRRKNKYPKFENHIKRFVEAQKKEAPNSYDTSFHYLKAYVLHFFLDRKQVQNPNSWHRHYEEFISYLQNDATLTGKSTKIQVSTQNKCIQTLNKFISVMQRHNIVDSRYSLKCRPIKDNGSRYRDHNFLIWDEAYDTLKSELKESKDFFIILYNTGMRFHELYSLPFCAIQSAENLPVHLKKRFKDYKTKIYGYIILESQLDGKTRSAAKEKAKTTKIQKKNVHEKESKYLRKPLKSCKEILPQNNRIIPIMDKETWEIIKTHYNIAVDKYASKTGDKNPYDYFLLDNIQLNKVRRDFAKKSKLGFHACRHTYITLLAGKFKDQSLIRIATAHKSESAFAHYNHLYQHMNASATLKMNNNDFAKIA